MKSQVFALAAAAVLGSSASVSAADITGKIVLNGKPPEEKILPLDVSCAKLHPGKATTRFYVVGKDKGLADTVIYLKENVPAGPHPMPSEPVVLDQKGCEYVPYVLAGRTGQTIVVKNSDPVFHNVHPTPAVAGNLPQNRAHLPKGPDLQFKWDNPELFLRFMCDVHPWMFSYVSLFDHPFFAVSAEDGTFTIKNVPPGKYTIEAFHRKAGKTSKEITVERDNVKADFDFDVKK